MQVLNLKDHSVRHLQPSALHWLMKVENFQDKVIQMCAELAVQEDKQETQINFGQKTLKDQASKT